MLTLRLLAAILLMALPMVLVMVAEAVFRSLKKNARLLS